MNLILFVHNVHKIDKIMTTIIVNFVFKGIMKMLIKSVKSVILI